MKLVIAEKPSVANDIAKVIGATKRGDGCLEGNGYIVTWCVGHLVTQKMPEEYDPDLKKWELKTLPFIPDKYMYKVCESTKKQFNIVRKLMQDSKVDSIVCATDAGREGELIFRLVYMMAGCKKPFERLWISSMTDSAIKKGFAELEPGRKYDPLFDAALARANADFVLGINGTRLYSVVYNKRLKVGRVKSPTLTMVVKRENEIRNFVKEPYFVVHLTSNGLDAKSEHIKIKQDAEELVSRLTGQTGRVLSVVSEDKKTKAPRLYNLSSLQIDANKYLGLSGEETLNILQKLYEEHKIVTYPRTDAEFLTEDMKGTVDNLLDLLSVNEKYKDLSVLAGRNTDVLLKSKKVSDHHALLPTEYVKTFDFNKLSKNEWDIFNLVTGRLLMAVSDPQEYVSTKLEVGFDDGTVFKQTGKVIKKDGWKEIEKMLKTSDASDKEKEEDTPMPHTSEGDAVGPAEFNITDHETKPPSRYTEGELIKAMDKAGVKDLDKDAERQGLGTSATRAGIIAELKADGLLLLEKKNLYPSEDAFKLVDVLPEGLKSVDMTVDWENKLVQISKGAFKYEDFMREIEGFVREMVKTNNTAQSGIVFENTGNTGNLKTPYLGACPKCGEKVLMGKFGAYCSGKCGIMLNKAYGKTFTDVQLKSILAGKKTLLKGCVSSKGSSYDMYVKKKGVKPYSYTDKDGKQHDGYVIDYETEFPEKEK